MTTIGVFVIGATLALLVAYLVTRPSRTEKKTENTTSRRSTAVVAAATAIAEDSRDWKLFPGTKRGCFQQVVGESHYQDALRDTWAAHRPERNFTAQLVAEPTNTYDPNAVYVAFAGQKLGYLPREDAAKYQQLILQIEATNHAAVCDAKLIGGEGAQSWGVVLDLLPPTVAAKELGLVYKRQT